MTNSRRSGQGPEGRGAATSASFWTISHAYSSSLPLPTPTHRLMSSTWHPCSLNAGRVLIGAWLVFFWWFLATHGRFTPFRSSRPRTPSVRQRYGNFIIVLDHFSPVSVLSFIQLHARCAMYSKTYGPVEKRGEKRENAELVLAIRNVCRLPSSLFLFRTTSTWSRPSRTSRSTSSQCRYGQSERARAVITSCRDLE